MSVSRQTAAARSREHTRGRLLSSGVQLFAERGLNGVTTHDIAREAGVASGTFYLHFSDKTALFHEIASDTEARLRSHIEQATRSAADLPGFVRAQVEALFDFGIQNRDTIRILFGGEAGTAGSALLDAFATRSPRKDVVPSLPARCQARSTRASCRKLWWECSAACCCGGSKNPIP